MSSLGSSRCGACWLVEWQLQNTFLKDREWKKGWWRWSCWSLVADQSRASPVFFLALSIMLLLQWAAALLQQAIHKLLLVVWLIFRKSEKVWKHWKFRWGSLVCLRISDYWWWGNHEKKRQPMYACQQQASVKQQSWKMAGEGSSRGLRRQSSATVCAEFNYRLGKTMGFGAFSKVKSATHSLTGKKVAIKIMNRHKMKDMEEKGIFSCCPSILIIHFLPLWPCLFLVRLVVLQVPYCWVYDPWVVGIQGIGIAVWEEMFLISGFFMKWVFIFMLKAPSSVTHLCIQ